MEVYYMKMRRNEYKESSKKKSGFFLRPGKKVEEAIWKK